MTDTNNENENLRPIDLIDCGLEDVVAALLHQHPILRPASKTPFILQDDDGRRLFAYYARNRQLWSRPKQVRAAEIENILGALNEAPPTAKATGLADTREHRTWRLRKVEAHRFAGLHRHCGANGEDPEIFVLDLESDVTLISGFNGAGKTALQNVIIWCLTGRALRSQHMPDQIHEPMNLAWIDGDTEAAPAGQIEISLPPIVPIPSEIELEALNDEPKIDTWAQVTFCHDESGKNCRVRRKLTVSSHGRINQVVTGLDELDLPNLAIEVGTLMPGIASHMRFDEKTTFAAAIAQLTGLKPLEDLGHRSIRVVNRLRTTEIENTNSEASSKLEDFRGRKQSIHDDWEAQPSLGETPPLINPDEEETKDHSKSSIAAARRELETTKQSLESTAAAILGRRIELKESTESDAFLSQLDEALSALGAAALRTLPSMLETSKLDAISNGDIARTRDLIADLLTRARTVSDRAQDRQQAARWRLYSRVAAWHREQHGDTTIEKCPVCGSDLEEVPPDALLDRRVSEALRECRAADADAAKGPREWDSDAAREMLEKLPDSVRVFSDNPPSEDLLQIYRKAYVDELLQLRYFGARLLPLRQNAIQVWELAIANGQLPSSLELKPTLWPKGLENGKLAHRCNNVELAIALCQQHSRCRDAIRAMLTRYVGNPGLLGDAKFESTEAEFEASNWPLSEQIRALQLCVTQTRPIVYLLSQLAELESKRKQHAALTDRVNRIDRAANAMESFAGFVDLVFQQVSGLISALDQGVQHWSDKIYTPHFSGGPAYTGLDAGNERGIGLRAGIGTLSAEAHKVMNASQLRACVWAYLLSLWERVRYKFGGIDCLLLDDPQNYFDPYNLENLAAAIPQMPQRGMRPLITSNDYRFMAAIRDKLPRESADPVSWQSNLINPISNSRLTAGISPEIEEVFEQQKSWRDDENNPNKARLFVSSVRIHIENRLWDLLAADSAILHEPTLSDLINALRTARNSGERPFEEPPFRALLTHDSLRDTAPFYRCINKAHHRPHEISPIDAVRVAEQLGQINRLLRSCSASYARFMGRLTREDKDLFLVDLAPSPQPATIAWEPLHILGEVSARSSADTLADGHSEDTFEISDLGKLALFGVRSQGLSPLVLQGQVVLASLNMEANDGDPVVAQCGGKTYLRRLLDDKSDPSRVVLACDRVGSENVPPTLLLPKARTRVMPIIGILYEQESFLGAEEVISIQESTLPHKKLVAALVKDDSAFPIIRSGDIVLMEAITNLEETELQRLDDRIVVAVVGEGTERFAYLKRLGGLAAPGVRILENIGVKGNAVSAATSQEAISSGIAPLQKIWRVHGTLRHSQ